MLCIPGGGEDGGGGRAGGFSRDWPIMLCCSVLTYYAQYYVHVKELCLKIC